MNLKADINNYDIIFKDGYWVPVCKNPANGKIIKILSHLKDKNKLYTESMFKGALKVMRKQKTILN